MATILSAIFGVLREIVVAREFGTTRDADAYFFAFSVSLGVAEFMWGGMAAALISVYAVSSKRGKDARETFASTIINLYLLFLAASAILIAIATPIVFPFIASGFDDQSLNLVIKIMWCLMPSIIVFGIWMTLRTLLEAERSFFVAQFSTAFVSVGVVAAVLLFAPQLGIYSLPAGITVGSLIQLLWVIYWLKRIGFRYRPTIDIQNEDFRRFLVVLGPGVLAGLISGAIPIIDRSMASHLPEGSISSLSFAERPMNLVCRFGLYSLITALLPTLAWKAANNDPKSFRDDVTRLLATLVFVITPLSLVLAALRVPIVKSLFERGNFDAEATAVTSNIFGVLILGLTPLSVAVALTTVFKSLQDTKTVAFVGGVSHLVSKTVFNLIFIVPFGVMGLAISSSLQHTVGGGLMLLTLRRRFGGIGARQLAITLAKSLTASLVAFWVVDRVVSGLQMSPFLQCITGALAGACVYLLLAAALRIEELYLSIDHLLRSAGFQRPPIRSSAPAE